MTGFSFRPVFGLLGRSAGIMAVALAVGILAAAAQEASTLPAPTQGVFDAVMKNDLAAAKRSVEAGADVTLRNTRGLTPAEFAVEIGNIEIANYLLAQERAQLRAQQTAKERPRATAKSDKSAAKKSEPARAKAPDKTQGAAQGKDRGETASVPPPPAAAEPGIVEPKRSRNFFRWIAGLMARDDEPPAPPAKPEEPKTTAKPEEPKTTAKPEEPKTTASEPPKESPRESPPAPAAKAKATKGKKAAEPLPPPEQSEQQPQQRSRNFFEWLADSMAGRESRSIRRPSLPEGLHGGPREPPVLSARDPWAATVTPTSPPPAAPAPAPAELAEAKPAPIPPPPEPVPGETAPGSWAPTLEHGGTTPAPEPRIAAVPEDPAKAEERRLLFSRPGAAPKSSAKKSDKEPGESGGLFGLGEKKDDAKDKGTEPDGGLWGSKVEMAQARPMVSAPPSAPPVPENVPVGLGFMVGRSLNLDKADPPRGSDEMGSRSCVEKSRGQVLFCVEATNWPKAMEADFTVNTILYTGQQAMVRYDRGRASRIQTLFPSESFDRVAAYYSGLYGPPAEAWTRSIAPLAVARRENPTRAWRARNPKTGEVATLEIRKFDDTRGGFPDTKRGVVMLYYHEASLIFPQVSALELMRLKRPPIGQPEKAR